MENPQGKWFVSSVKLCPPVAETLGSGLQYSQAALGRVGWASTLAFRGLPLWPWLLPGPPPTLWGPGPVRPLLSREQRAEEGGPVRPGKIPTLSRCVLANAPPGLPSSSLPCVHKAWEPGPFDFPPLLMESSPSNLKGKENEVA